jgi:23S rRNA (pseudouridine1915-N3)-methyltransferase
LHIHVLTVGKLKETFLKQGVAEYEKRLNTYTNLKIVEVLEEPAPETLSDKEAELVKQREGKRLLSHLKAHHYVIALAIEGKSLSSEQFAAHLDRLATYGNSHIAFVIGGSLGLSDDVLRRADFRLSFSPMTFPHQLMRLILLEQIYRGFKIMRGEPYHK